MKKDLLKIIALPLIGFFAAYFITDNITNGFTAVAIICAILAITIDNDKKDKK